MYGGGGIAPSILNPGIDRDEWSASRPDRFIPGESAPATHWIGVLVSPRASVDAVARRRKSIPLPGIEPRLPSPQLVHSTH
jgi:hypothetical protein